MESSDLLSPVRQEEGVDSVIDCTDLSSELCKSLIALDRIAANIEIESEDLASIEDLLVAAASSKDDSLIDLEALQQQMEMTFGYDLEWYDDFPQDTQSALLLNLLTSNMHSVAVFEQEFQMLSFLVKTGDVIIVGERTLSALDMFRRLFPQDPDGQGRITLMLGADERTGDPTYGLTPLEQSLDKTTPETYREGLKGLYMMYLGSQMTVEGITHEMAHQVDRSLYPESDTDPHPGELSPSLSQLFSDSGLGPIDSITQFIVQDRLAVFDPDILAETFADLGMSTVLHGHGFENIGLNEQGYPRNVSVARNARAAFLLVTFDPGISQVCFPGNDGNRVCYPDDE
jgi:hypothetical protein